LPLAGFSWNESTRRSPSTSKIPNREQSASGTFTAPIVSAA
jgi:hypothetical protein